MGDPDELPLPIARALSRIDEAGSAAACVLAAYDAAHTITKYVGLVRLAAWWRTAPDAGAVGAPIAASLRKVFWGADPLSWWQFSKELRLVVAPLPRAWDWDQLEQRMFQALNSERPRHRSTHGLIGAAASASETTAIVKQLIVSAKPLLRLPLVAIGDGARVVLHGTHPWPVQGLVEIETDAGSIGLNPFLAIGGAPLRLMIYERLVTSGAVIYACDAEHLPPQDDAGVFAALRAWEAASNRAASVAKAASKVATLAMAKARSDLRNFATRVAGRALIETDDAVKRPIVDETWSRIPPEGTGVLMLIGPSGIGKSHELRRMVHATSRTPLWIRAVSWEGQDLATLLGEALTGEVGVPLAADRIAELCEGEGLLIAVDGLNEAVDPGRLVDALCWSIRRIASGSVHLVITSTPEAADAATARLEPSWFTDRSVCQLGPIEEGDARKLAGLSDSDFDALPHATRMLLRVPLLALLARAAAADDHERATGSIDEILERFVRVQTSDLGRALLRAVCAKLFAARVQTLTRVHYEDASTSSVLLREALSGEGELAMPLQKLVRRGLLIVTGDAASSVGLRVAIAHDRLLQWLAGRWLVVQRRDTLARAWGVELAGVTHVPPHALAVGYALAYAHPDGDEIASLAASEDEIERAAARLAIEAIAETSPDRVQPTLERAWARARDSEQARIELVAVAADLGVASVVADALGDPSVRDPAAFALSRVARRDSKVVASALEKRWDAIGGHPWLRIGSTIRVLHALVHARFGEGANPQNPKELRTVAQRIVSDLVGRGRGPASAAVRRMLIGSMALLVRGIVAIVPQGPTSNMPELLRAFRDDPEERSWWRPMVQLFSGDLTPRHVAETVRRVAGERAVAPTILLERALIAASRRLDTSEDALDLALEAGEIGQALNPPSMAAQSVLYVLSSHLERTDPSHPTWNARLADFDRALHGWMRSAPRRRWRSDSGNEYKSLFVAAHSRLHRNRDTKIKRTPLLEELWERACAERDELLTMDLLDDLQILAISRRENTLALEGLEPLLAQRDWVVPKRVHAECLELVRAVHERDPAATEQLLGRGDEPNRLRLAHDLRLGRASKTAGYAIFLDFDDAIVLHDGLRPTITRVFKELIEARSASAFISFVLRLAANRVLGAGAGVFAELDQ